MIDRPALLPLNKLLIWTLARANSIPCPAPVRNAVLRFRRAGDVCLAIHSSAQFLPQPLGKSIAIIYRPNVYQHGLKLLSFINSHGIIRENAEVRLRHLDVVPACRSVSRDARIFHFVSILLLIPHLNQKSIDAAIAKALQSKSPCYAKIARTYGVSRYTVSRRC